MKRWRRMRWKSEEGGEDGEGGGEKDERMVGFFLHFSLILLLYYIQGDTKENITINITTKK